MTKGLCKSAKEQHLFTQHWLIQRHSRGIMGIISPTLCHKCMQHASECQEQWPLSLPSTRLEMGRCIMGSRQADKLVQWSADTWGRPHTNPGNKQWHSRLMGHVWIMGLDYGCFTQHSRKRAGNSYTSSKCDTMFSLVFEVKALIWRIDCFRQLTTLIVSNIYIV